MTRLVLGAHLAKIKTDRAAVVPYIIRNGKIYFLLAIDRNSGDITDLGGGVQQDEMSLIAALREFREESDEIFGSIYSEVNEQANRIALLGNRMSVLFIPVDEVWFDKAPKDFIRRRRSRLHSTKRSHNEVSRLLWISERQFGRLIQPKNREMWTRLQRFYRQGYTTDLLEALKITYNT